MTAESRRKPVTMVVEPIGGGAYRYAPGKGWAAIAFTLIQALTPIY